MSEEKSISPSVLGSGGTNSLSQRHGRQYSKSPAGVQAPAVATAPYSDLSELQTSEGGGRIREGKQVIKKRRSERRGTGGGDSSEHHHHHHHHSSRSKSSSNKELIKPTGISIASRLNRAQWVIVMLTPLTLLILHRIEACGVESGGWIDVQSTLMTSIGLGLVFCINELADGLLWPYFPMSLFLGVVFGVTVNALGDLIAARILVAGLFGVGAGLLRYHWVTSQQHHDALARYERKKQRRALAAAQITADGHGTATASDSDFATRKKGAQETSTSTTPQSEKKKKSSSAIRGGFSNLCRFLANRIGLSVWFAVGELIGISIFVNEGLGSVILPGWSGYGLLVIFPLLTYKISSWVSHALTLMFGSSRSISDAGWMLAVYWVSTAALSLGILIFVLVFVIWSWVPYVWSLQQVVAPYGIVFEFIANESRGIVRENPYREVVAAYGEHITTTKKDRKRWFC